MSASGFPLQCCIVTIVIVFWHCILVILWTYSECVCLIISWQSSVSRDIASGVRFCLSYSLYSDNLISWHDIVHCIVTALWTHNEWFCFSFSVYVSWQSLLHHHNPLENGSVLPLICRDNLHYIVTLLLQVSLYRDTTVIIFIISWHLSRQSLLYLDICQYNLHYIFHIHRNNLHNILTSITTIFIIYWQLSRRSLLCCDTNVTIFIVCWNYRDKPFFVLSQTLEPLISFCLSSSLYRDNLFCIEAILENLGKCFLSSSF